MNVSPAHGIAIHHWFAIANRTGRHRIAPAGSRTSRSQSSESTHSVDPEGEPMSHRSISDRQLLNAASLICTRRRSRPIIERWAIEPALNSLDPADVIELIARPKLAGSNTALAALIRLGQGGDPDAVVAALAGLRLGLWGVVHRRCGHRDDAFDELLAQTTFILARIDPRLDRLYDRILGRARAAVLRLKHHQLVETLCDEFFETELGVGRIDPVGDQVIARLNLDRLVDLAADHRIDHATWAALVATRVGGVRTDQIDDPRTPSHLRADTSKLARRLAHLLDVA